MPPRGLWPSEAPHWPSGGAGSGSEPVGGVCGGGRRRRSLGSPHFPPFSGVISLIARPIPAACRRQPGVPAGWGAGHAVACGGPRWLADGGSPKRAYPGAPRLTVTRVPSTHLGQLPASGSRRGSDAQWPEQVTLHHEPFRTPGPAPTPLAGALGTRPPTKVWRDRPSHCALGGPSLSIFLP